MFSRSFKRFFARMCVALLFMQFAVAGYACASLAYGTTAGSPMITVPGDSDAMMSSGCDDQPRNIGNSKVCHQHYAGDFSVGATDVASAPPAPEVPAIMVDAARPASGWRVAMLPVLLRRAIGPSLSVRFQVLRI